MKAKRAYAPHCDSSVLHAPGRCSYCDEYADWQEYRSVARISFTGEPVLNGWCPCPSTWTRDPATRDRWYGNAPLIREEPRPAPDNSWVDFDQVKIY